MTNVESASVFIAMVAVLFAALTVWRTEKSRKADSFANLYDEFNKLSFSKEMRIISKWVEEVAKEAKKEVNGISEADIQLAYWDYLLPIYESGDSVLDDDKDNARRNIKAWFIKCLLLKKAHDLSKNQLKALITSDRAVFMLRIFAMTRAQTFVWKKLKHDAHPSLCSDQPYFDELNKIFREEIRKAKASSGPPQES
jgi:hypothetical protein